MLSPPVIGLAIADDLSKGPAPATSGSVWNLNLTLRGPGRQSPRQKVLGVIAARISKRPNTEIKMARDTVMHRTRRIDHELTPPALGVRLKRPRRQRAFSRGLVEMDLAPGGCIAYERDEPTEWVQEWLTSPVKSPRYSDQIP